MLKILYRLFGLKYVYITPYLTTWTYRIQYDGNSSAYISHGSQHIYLTEHTIQKYRMRPANFKVVDNAMWTPQ